MAAPMKSTKLPFLNVNIGVLGHVDSGKTSLVKSLSTIASTAAFDKNPQSKERGITLDLGFSSFSVDIPDHLKTDKGDGEDQKLQYTLVDCPGHASLIKTIIGGAQIIDLMILVIDVIKGMQTQTAECLIIGEITCEKMVVVLNKVDLIPEPKRDAAVEKLKKRMLKTLETTKFRGSPIVPVAAKPGGPESSSATSAIGMDDLIETLRASTVKPVRSADGPFHFAVDHCFAIKGVGTVMTGTVHSGCVSVGDTVEIPSMKITKKVKSIQMFKQPVERAIQGDRIGLCVTQFDPKLLERGLACSEGALPTIVAAIASVQKINYFKPAVCTKSKFHITLGHETAMGRLTFFGHGNESESTFDFASDYKYQDELEVDRLVDGEKVSAPRSQFVLIELEKPVTCSQDSLVIGSRMDADIHSNMCRIAFWGRVLVPISDVKYAETVLPNVRVYKDKLKVGVVERVADECSLIAKNIFKKETNINLFAGLKVALSTGEEGVIEGGFGQSGKVKVRIPKGVQDSTKQLFAGKKKSRKGKEHDSAMDAEPAEAVQLFLKFKRYVYDPKKQMIQS